MVESATLELQPVEPPERSRRTRIGLAVALVVAVLAIGTLIAARAINVIGRPAANQLATIGSAGGLHTIDERGENPRDFPAAGFNFQFPAWSPDGSRIAAIGIGPGGTGVFVFDTRSKEPPRPITAFQAEDHPPFYLYWTPDSRQVTFLTSERQNLALRIAPADGSGEGAVIREGQPMYWALSESARLVVHSGGIGDEAFLGELGLDGGTIEPSGLPPGPFRAPAVSAGQRRAYEVTESDGSERIVIDARNDSIRKEIAVAGLAVFGFSPAGSELAYVANPTPVAAGGQIPFGPLRVIDPVSGHDRLLLDGDVVAFFWAPDGRSIAAFRISTSEEEQNSARTGGATLAVARPRQPATRESAAAPGVILRLVFIDVPSGQVRHQRSARLSELFVNQVLPYFDQYALSHRFWSPDSEAIVLPLVDDRPEPQITVIPADGSEPRALGPGTIAFWSP